METRSGRCRGCRSRAKGDEDSDCCTEEAAAIVGSITELSGEAQMRERVWCFPTVAGGYARPWWCSERREG